MTALILPEMKGTYDDALLRSTSRKLVNVFHLAYSQAVAINQLHQVRFDLKDGRFFIERKSRDRGHATAFAPVQNIPGGEGKLDTRIVVELRRAAGESSDPPEQAAPLASEADSQTNKGEAIAFYPDGTADAVEIVLRDREGFRLGLRINPTTAHVRIVELERE
ncbi:MAG: hypothetical protein L0Z50_27555 [Verrucomicrobiales bacterium]|nr:hypothetical protein [Verrucomicrobiales bacterium]